MKKISVTKALKNTKMGIFRIIIPKDKSIKPTMYGNSTLFHILKSGKSDSPEEFYLNWLEKINSDYYDYVCNLFENICKRQNIEIEFRWNVKKGEEIYIRLNSVANIVGENIEIEGYQQDITEFFEENIFDDKSCKVCDNYKFRKYADYLMDFYDEIYEIDIETKELKTIYFKKNKNNNVEEGSIFDIIEKNVHEDDKAVIYSILNEQVIDKMRKEGVVEKIEFRSKTHDGAYEWLRVNCKFSFIDGREKILIYGYVLKEKKQIMMMEKEKEAIISAIVEDHTDVVDIDIVTGKIILLKSQNYKYVKQSYINQFIRDLTKEYIQKSDISKVEYFLSYENLKNISANDINTYCDFQLKTDSFGYAWLRISVIGMKALKNRVVLMLKDVSSQHMLEMLMNEYISKNCEDLFYIDCNTLKFLKFGSNDINSCNSAQKGYDYVSQIAKYADKFVVKEDKDFFKRKMRLTNVLNDLETQGFCNISYGTLDKNNDYKRKFAQFQYYDKQNKIILLMVSDITDSYNMNIEEQEKIKKIKKEAVTDYLTGIYNRLGLEREFEESIFNFESGVSAFILLDLDNFKQVNDLLGHATGDKALKDVANILKRNFRDSDLIGRLGGDEFVIIMKNIKSSNMIPSFMKRLLKALQIEYYDCKKTVGIAASIGVALFPRDGKTFDELYKNSDKALYYVKNNDKNGCIIYGEDIIYTSD